MMPTVCTVVEGHGEVEALPVLLRRVADELLDVPFIEVPRPFRQGRGSLVRPGGIERAVELTRRRVGGHGGVLVLLDADDDCPADMAPQLLARANAAAAGIRTAVVLATREYEGWFLAAADSLAGKRDLDDALQRHPDPEQPRDAKGWLTHRMPAGRTYTETLDQAPLSAAMDLQKARDHAASFDVLVRRLESLLA